MKLAVLAIAVLALTGCKTTPFNRQHITDYGDGVEIPERARPNEATKRYYLRAQNYWMRTNIRRGRGLLGRFFEGPFMQLLNAMIIIFNIYCVRLTAVARARNYTKCGTNCGIGTKYIKIKSIESIFYRIN